MSPALIQAAPATSGKKPVSAIWPGGHRIPALDALRGIAALSVVWFHVYRFTRLRLVLHLPSWADAVVNHGSLGVEVFFVLSGIVITLSIAGNRITWAYVGRFTLRRSVRLDPPYWATLIAATLILSIRETPPGMGSFLAHVVYLQNVLGYNNIVSQFWTLCYEIQFYLVLVLLVWLGQRGGILAGYVVAIVPVAISLRLLVSGVSAHGWFIDWWYAFACGAATTGMLTGRLRRSVWALLAVVIVAAGIVIESPEAITVAITGLAIGFAGIAGKLMTWTGGAVLQWLGRISYSLYLVHFVGTVAARWASGYVQSPVGGALVFIMGTAIAILAAEVLYRLVERPTHRWARLHFPLNEQRAA